MVQTILDFEGDVEYRGGPKGETPLLWAAAQGSLSCLKLLLQLANTAASDSTGKGILSVAICHEQVAVMEILLQRPEVDIHFCDAQGISPLGHAVREGRLHAVKTLLGNPQVEAAIRNGANEGILHDAVERDHLEVVRVLLSCDFVTRNSCVLIERGSPLHCAVRGNGYLPTLVFGYEEFAVYHDEFPGMPPGTVLKLLLESGLFDVNAVDGDGMTALHHACMLAPEVSSALEGIEGTSGKRDFGAVGSMLLELCSTQGINLDVVDNKGETALYKALQARNLAHVRVLVAKGVRVKVEGAKRISCMLENRCRENDVEFDGLSDFKAHMTEHYYK